MPYRLKFDDYVWWRITCRIPMRLFIGSVFSWHIYGPAIQNLSNLYFQSSHILLFLPRSQIMFWYQHFMPYQVEPESSSCASAMVSIHLKNRVITHVRCLLLFNFWWFLKDYLLLLSSWLTLTLRRKIIIKHTMLSFNLTWFNHVKWEDMKVSNFKLPWIMCDDMCPYRLDCFWVCLHPAHSVPLCK